MRTLEVLLPMGGLGSRFVDKGYNLPKPLIPIDGLPMFLRAISSLDRIAAPKRFTFVFRTEHALKYRLDKTIRTRLPGADIVLIEDLTRGPVETCLAAQRTVEPNNGLLVMDCDLWFSSQGYEKLIEDSLQDLSNTGGVLLYFPSTNPQFSFAELDGSRVLRTAEKVPISQNALVGAYFFSHAKLFFSAAQQLMAKPLGFAMKEYYVSLLFNTLIAEGKAVMAASVDEYFSFGTPLELDQYHLSSKRGCSF